MLRPDHPPVGSAFSRELLSATTSLTFVAPISSTVNRAARQPFQFFWCADRGPGAGRGCLAPVHLPAGIPSPSGEGIPFQEASQCRNPLFISSSTAPSSSLTAKQLVLRRQDGHLVLTFGKYAGVSLERLAEQEPDYLRWLARQHFLPDFLALLEHALQKAC